jgi:hypothetical protein
LAQIFFYFIPLHSPNISGKKVDPYHHILCILLQVTLILASDSKPHAIDDIGYDDCNEPYVLPALLDMKIKDWSGDEV